MHQRDLMLRRLVEAPDRVLCRLQQHFASLLLEVSLCLRERQTFPPWPVPMMINPHTLSKTNLASAFETMCDVPPCCSTAFSCV
jgi:hypothetical protein